jgi:hypothetical protein
MRIGTLAPARPVLLHPGGYFLSPELASTVVSRLGGRRAGPPGGRLHRASETLLGAVVSNGVDKNSRASVLVRAGRWLTADWTGHASDCEFRQNAGRVNVLRF